MKLPRIATSLAVLLLILSVSCTKKDESPYQMTITGVALKTVDALPAGTSGIPDVHTQDDRFFISAYPIPCIEICNLYIRNQKAPTQLSIKLFSVVYKDAPATAIIENTPIVGSCLINETINVPGGNISINYTMDVSKLPRGFYRVYAETADGTSYWDNIWLMR
jgi:hypothetical protein